MFLAPIPPWGVYSPFYLHSHSFVPGDIRHNPGLWNYIESGLTFFFFHIHWNQAGDGLVHIKKKRKKKRWWKKPLVFYFESRERNLSWLNALVKAGLLPWLKAAARQWSFRAPLQLRKVEAASREFFCLQPQQPSGFFSNTEIETWDRGKYTDFGMTDDWWSKSE